jgi:glutamate synthase domain-containing protein 3
MYTIDAQGLDYRQLNSRVREVVNSGADKLSLVNINGQRYIACGLEGSLEIEITGTGGTDLGAYIKGPRITVRGSVQDCVGNTMNSGSIIVEGRAGDILGYGMSGGEIFIRGDVGSRAGIHLKGLEGRAPVMVIGGTAGDFLGEYMAAGTIIVLGIDSDIAPTGRQCGVGMHGGAIYVTARTSTVDAGSGTIVSPPTGDDLNMIAKYVERFAQLFNLKANDLMEPGFYKIVPVGHRPYGSMYVGV